MKQYLDVMKRILSEGQDVPDRTGTGTYSIFGPRLSFDLNQGFPLVTTKKIHTKSVIWELLWFLQGRTDVQWLQERGVKIWNEWADEEGDLGHIYGYQWRKWPKYLQSFAKDENTGLTQGVPHTVIGVDQVGNLIDGLLTNPHGRRHIVSAWNVSDLGNMRLPPCHMFFQCYVRRASKCTFLDLTMYQRSADWFLGVPFNIASYALLTHLLAYHTGFVPGKLIMNFGDAHLYLNHIKQAEEQLERVPKDLPNIDIAHHSIWEDYDIRDFQLHGYDPFPAISASISV